MGNNKQLLNPALGALPQNIIALPVGAAYYRLLDNIALATVVHNLFLVKEY